MKNNIQKRTYLHAGDLIVTDKAIELSTVLGSCVAVCLWDSKRGLGGMNHYLGILSTARDSRENRYGEKAIENLLKGMYDLGAKRQDLKCSVFGGGKVIDLMYDVGAENIRVAREMLGAEGINVGLWDVGGGYGRRLFFNTGTGETFVRKVDNIKDKFTDEDKARRNAERRARNKKSRLDIFNADMENGATRERGK